MPKFVFFALLAVFPAVPAFAGGGPGTSGAEFLAIGIGARPAGLAETFVGVADDVHSLIYNPAGLAFLDRQEISLDHDSYADGVNHEWIGYARPTPYGTVALSANMLFVAPFESYGAADNPAGKTSAADSAYQFGYAAQLTRDFAVGATGKIVSSRLNDVAARTFAGDAGALWRPTETTRIGAAVTNFGPGIRYVSETFNLPTALRGGASWTPFSAKDYRNSFTLSADVEKRVDDSARFGAGMELVYDNVLAMRAGGRTLPGDGNGLTLGVGLYLFRDETRPYEIDFDYAFVAAGDFATSHRAGILVRFGESMTAAAHAPVFRKSSVYYDDADKIKSRTRRAEPAEAPKRPRPSAEPSITPSDFQWVTP